MPRGLGVTRGREAPGLRPETCSPSAVDCSAVGGQKGDAALMDIRHERRACYVDANRLRQGYGESAEALRAKAEASSSSPMGPS